MENLFRDYIFDNKNRVYIAKRQLTYGRAKNAAKKLGIKIFPKKYDSFIQIDYCIGLRNFNDIDKLF